MNFVLMTHPNTQLYCLIIFHIYLNLFDKIDKSLSGHFFRSKNFSGQSLGNDGHHSGEVAVVGPQNVGVIGLY